MSLPFSDTTNFKGIVQIAEDEAGVERGFISGNPNRLKKATAHANLGWDTYLPLAFKSSGTHQMDDTNHVDGSGNYTFPIIKTALTQGRRDYFIGPDEQGNLVLDVHKVLIKPSATAAEYVEIYPVDQQTRNQAVSITSESTTQGVPAYYDKTAGTIILDVPPSYTVSDGLKVLVNREPSYFVYTDTTKKPGCPGSHHKYFALKMALAFAPKGSKLSASIEKEIAKYEGDEERGIVGSIERHFARRSRDERSIMKPRITPYL